MKEKRMDANFRQRLQRRLHYGDMASLDVPSLPLTELAVDYFHDSIPEKLGHVDLYSASNVIRRNQVSPCSVVLSMLYAKRLRQQTQRNKDLLRTMSSADVFFISMMMASKYLYDEGVEEEVFNDVWAENTDQDVDDVNQMEVDFLQAMDWRLFVRPQEFEDTLAAVERRLALQEGLKRGWYTYTEMDILMSSDLMWLMWTNVGWECSKLLTAISAAYVTSLFSLVGSTALAVQVSGQLSSVAVTLLALQSSQLMHAVSTGLSSPIAVNSAPLSIRHSDTLDTDTSHLDTVGFSLKKAITYETWNQNDKWKVELDKGLISTHSPTSEESGNDSDSHETSHGYDKYEPPALSTKPPHQSSWFFDSLVSQVWAVFCIRSNLAIFNWSLSGRMSSLKESDAFGSTLLKNGIMDRDIPKFQGRRRELKSRSDDSADKGTRKFTFQKRTAFHNTGVVDQAPTCQELCNSHEVGAQDNLCSNHCFDPTSWTCPCHHLSQTTCCRIDPSSSHGHHNLKILPNFPVEHNSLKPATDHVLDNLIHHICGVGHSCQTETNHDASRQCIANNPSNVQESSFNNCHISPQLQAEFKIPKGFFTSVSHAILAT